MARSLNQATKAGFALHSGGGGDAAAVKNDPLWQRAWKNLDQMQSQLAPHYLFFIAVEISDIHDEIAV